jgi:hypothetical protein
MAGRFCGSAQAAGPTRGTAAHGSFRSAPGATAASLCRAQTQAVCGVCARRPGRGRYSGRASGAGRGLQTVHRPRCDLALGCSASAHACHRANRNSVPDTCITACPFPFAPCRSTVARSSPPSSNRPASSVACTCSCSLRVPPNSTAPSNAPNRNHTEDFYQVTPCSLEMTKLNRELRQWEKIYNTVRPHQALGCLTPQQFLRQISSQRKE